jgi:hypothetical protein
MPFGPLPALDRNNPLAGDIAAAIRRARATTESGAWRPDLPFDGDEGLKITLRRQPGMTPAGMLQVPFRFQAPPLNELTRPWTYDWQTQNTVAAGEQAREGGPQLDRLNFETMFLDEELQWMVWTGSFDVQRMLDELRALLDEPAPFRLTIGQPALWGPRPLVNIIAVFTSITPTNRGGEIGTEYTSVEFLEITRQRLQQRSSGRTPGASAVPRRTTIKKGDTLYKIALRMYQQKSAWRPIAKANGMAGVSPDDADELARWAKAHGRTTLVVPAATDTVGVLQPAGGRFLP